MTALDYVKMLFKNMFSQSHDTNSSGPGGYVPYELPQRPMYVVTTTKRHRCSYHAARPPRHWR